MAKPIKVKIDLSKVEDKHVFGGKNGARYLDFVLWRNKDGEERYGMTHYAVQEVPREAREAGEKGKIIGNANVPVEGDGQQAQQPARQPYRPQAKSPDTQHQSAEKDDVPF